MKLLVKIKLFFLVIFFVAAAVSGDNLFASQEFSADMVNRSGSNEMQARIWVGDQKIRIEMNQSIMINRLDKNVLWMLMPSEGMYMEHPIDPTLLAKTNKQMPGEVERKSLGSELINGQSAEKYHVTYSQSGHQSSVYQWIGQGDIPIKIESVDGDWAVEYRNIQLGPQPGNLFEIPAGLKKMNMPSMQDIMNQSGNG